MEPAVGAVGIVAGILALWLGSRWLAAGIGVSPLVIGLTVVGFGTSAPSSPSPRAPRSSACCGSAR